MKPYTPFSFTWILFSTSFNFIICTLFYCLSNKLPSTAWIKSTYTVIFNLFEFGENENKSHRKERHQFICKSHKHTYILWLNHWGTITHTQTVGNILSMFLFEFIVELILSSKILCTLRCVTFINLTSSYDKQNAYRRCGFCCRWCWWFWFFNSEKVEGKHWVKEKESFNHIKFNDINSMLMMKINLTKKQTKVYAHGQNWWRSRKKSLRWQILTPFNAWTEWKFVICFSLSPSIEIVIYDIFMHVNGSSFSSPHSNHLDSQNKLYHSIRPRHGFLSS